MTTTFTGSTKVWISSPEYYDISGLKQLIADGDLDRAVDYLSMASNDMSSNGWVEVGTASVTVTLHDSNELHEKALEGLHKQLQEVRAENHRRESFILDRISKLQAITYEPAAA